MTGDLPMSTQWCPVIDSAAALSCLSESLSASSFPPQVKWEMQRFVTRLLSGEVAAQNVQYYQGGSDADGEENWKERTLEDEEQIDFDQLMAMEGREPWPYNASQLVRPSGSLRTGGVKLWFPSPRPSATFKERILDGMYDPNASFTLNLLRQQDFDPRIDFASSVFPLPTDAAHSPQTILSPQVLSLLVSSFRSRLLRALNAGGVHILFGGWDLLEAYKKSIQDSHFEEHSLPVSISFPGSTGTWTLLRFLRPKGSDAFTNVVLDAVNPENLVFYDQGHWQRTRYDFAVMLSRSLTERYREWKKGEIRRLEEEEIAKGLLVNDEQEISQMGILSRLMGSLGLGW
ncbi:hypothetical protein FRC03_002953 [Tulasnella sp. 419]|nr:hypothetical protein FRC02_004248 [Tulasnella sp. 418]KAG8963484.1 hypothetical protein FRC03_002953 [Tulasnella sp. 419]